MSVRVQTMKGIVFLLGLVWAADCYETNSVKSKRGIFDQGGYASESYSGGFGGFEGSSGFGGGEFKYK